MFISMVPFTLAAFFITIARKKLLYKKGSRAKKSHDKKLCYVTVKAVRDPFKQWTQLGVGAPWTTFPHAASNVPRTSRISAFGQQFPGIRSIPASDTLDALHLSDTNSRWQHNVPWGP